MAKSQYYQRLKLKSEQDFRRFTGLTKYEFSAVLQIFLEYVEENWDKRGRYISGELKADFTDEDKLLLTFRYLRDYGTFLVVGNEFGICESYAHVIFTKVTDSLVKLFHLPSTQDLKNLDIKKAIADVSEQQTERPKVNQKKSIQGRKNITQIKPSLP
jgi:Helix-turn-helix of DDE superfamily endonuclease